LNDPPAAAFNPTAVLTYAALDDHAIACASAARPQAPLQLPVDELGPQIEHLLLAAQGVVPSPNPGPLTRASMTADLNRLIELADQCAVLRLARDPLPETTWTQLTIRAKRAAEAAGFASRSAGQLAAALGEMLSNILEHSGAPETGLVAFRGSERLFEFVVADQGIGALASLRSNPKYATLATARDALPLVLQSGCSCTGDSGRGMGFDDLFRGLANHNGRLRFRSDDAAVTIDGQSPSAIRPKVKQRPPFRGFAASVCCTPV